MQFIVEFNQTLQTFDAAFKQTQYVFDADFKEVNIVIMKPQEYDGDYIVTPKVDAQLLETQDKFMRDNVNIKAIPYYNVHNTSGGSTIYIGKEII